MEEKEKELTQEELEKAAGGLKKLQASEPGTGETQRPKFGYNDPPRDQGKGKVKEL